ncbi:MAG: FHA domain-containing protein, partial [Pauljensenia sp.]
ATILRLAPVNSGPAAPVAFLIHGGTVPVEVSRDVVIGRDPDASALTGRPPATVLRVPSPATEISRSHCAVMMTAPGSWALMDLGSANGTVLRHADGSFQDVTPMVTLALNDGDLIDVGEGTTIEFRVR